MVPCHKTIIMGRPMRKHDPACLNLAVPTASQTLALGEIGIL